MIGILLAIVILAIAFGSLVAMSLPIVAALVAIVSAAAPSGSCPVSSPVPADHRRRRR